MTDDHQSQLAMFRATRIRLFSDIDAEMAKPAHKINLERLHEIRGRMKQLEREISKYIERMEEA